MNGKWLLGVIAAAIALLLLSLSMFTVGPAQYALMFRFGKIVETQFQPGLHFKAPFVNKVIKFDKRVLTLDSAPERFLTVEKKNLLVDFFVKWRINDPLKFYRATGGSESAGAARLAEIIKNGLRSEFGSRTVQQVVSGERSQVMAAMRVEANQAAGEFGVGIVDVRVKRIDLPKEVSGAVFDRMRSARKQVAQQYRAEGAQLAEQIRAKADKQHTVIIADAQKQAQQIRGEGDAKASAIYAAAYGKDPDFYAFYRSLNAYRESLDGKRSLLVLSPDSQFFKYLQSAKPRH